MKRTPKQRSVRQERRIAQDLGGRTTPASGARWGARRDVRSDAWLVEAKTTGQRSYRVEEKDLDFLKRQAYRLGRTPAYVVELQGRGELVVLPIDAIDLPINCVQDCAGRSGFTLQDGDLECTPIHMKMGSGDYAVITYGQFIELDAAFTP